MGLILQIVLLTFGLIGILASVFAMPKSATRTLITIGSAALFLAGLTLTILTYADPPTAQEIATRVVSILRGSPVKLNHPPDEKLPGFGSGMMVETKDVTEMRRKYHFDFHTPDGAKAGFYLSASNRYAFSVTDIHGEPYTLDIPLGSNGIPFETWSYVFCEIGTASGYAYLRALVNGTEVARRDFDFPIDLGSRQWMATIGADSSGRNSGALMLAEIGVFSMTFTDAELKKSPKTPYNSIRQNDEINIHRSPLQKYPHYRVNRVDHRRCWFVSSQGGSGHSRPRRTTSVGRRHFVSRSRHEVPHVQYDREVNPEMASAQMAPPDAALPLEQAPLPDFAARWPDLPSSQDLGPRKVATISYTRPTTNAPTLPTPSVGAKRAVEQSSAGEAFNSVFFGGALTATLLVAGGVSYFARRRRRTPRDERHATTEGPDQATHMFARSDRLTGNKWPVQTRHHASDRQTSPPTVPADDPEKGLRDPTFDLRRSFFWGI